MPRNVREEEEKGKGEGRERRRSERQVNLEWFSVSIVFLHEVSRLEEQTEK